MGIDGPWSNQRACLAPKTFLVPPLPFFLPSRLNCILNYTLSPSPEHKYCPSGVGFVPVWHGGLPVWVIPTVQKRRPTGKHINAAAPYRGLVLGSQPHICLCSDSRSSSHPTHTWDALLPACLQKDPPQGYPGRQCRQNKGFENSRVRELVLNASRSNHMTSQVFYLLIRRAASFGKQYLLRLFLTDILRYDKSWDHSRKGHFLRTK